MTDEMFYIIFSDIDECALKTDKCQQECQNVVGSYNCQCKVGYTLNSDRKNCLAQKGNCLCNVIYYRLFIVCYSINVYLFNCKFLKTLKENIYRITADWRSSPTLSLDRITADWRSSQTLSLDRITADWRSSQTLSLELHRFRYNEVW